MGQVERCRYCGEGFTPERPPVPTTAYWGGYVGQCHADCKRDGERQEAYDCQVIDADCNDCRHFRAYRQGELGYVVSKHRRVGWCQRHDRETVAFPVFCSGRPCFVHRRSP